MNLQPYTNVQDLQDMLDLLSAGRKANNGTYYVHRGDVQWWLFYLNSPQENWQPNIRLLRENDRLLAWILFSMDENAFDLCVQPKLRGTETERALFAYAVNHLSALDFIDVYWVAEDDSARMELLREHGFSARDGFTALLTRGLSDPLTMPAMPNGFALRNSRGTPEDAHLRSVASYAAFESSLDFESYVERTWRFMQSPVYVPENEFFIESQDGCVASFCTVWKDELNRAAHIEPMGTHPDFQRKGLGRRLLMEVFAKLQAEGMEEISLTTGGGNDPALALYESVGFQLHKKILTFTKQRE